MKGLNTFFKSDNGNSPKANPENPEKSHLLTNTTRDIQMRIRGMAISNSKCQKFLRFKVDKKLIFK